MEPFAHYRQNGHVCRKSMNFATAYLNSYKANLLPNFGYFSIGEAKLFRCKTHWRSSEIRHCMTA